MSRSFILGFLVGVALLIVVGVGASKLQSKEAQRIDAEEKAYQAEIVDANPVQLGILTQQQRIHSKLYTQYLERRGGKTISGLVAQATGKSRIVETVAFVGLTEVLTEAETPENYFGNLTRASDAVVRGRVTSKVSQITEDDAFIFTDYDITVTEVLKNNAITPIEMGSTITVTRPGGKVLVNGIIVKATDKSSEALSSNGNDVVLFLQFIPETGAYRATQDTGSFELDDSSLRPLTKSQFPPGVLQNKDSFIQTIRAVSNQ